MAMLQSILLWFFPALGKALHSAQGTAEQPQVTKTDDSSKIKEPAPEVEFFNRDWFTVGFHAGLDHHSENIFRTSIINISHTYNSILISGIDDLERKIQGIKKDLLQTDQTNDEMLGLLNIDLAHLQRKVDKYKEQLSKIHSEDEHSKCYAIITSYKNGFITGRHKYLRTRGESE